MITGTLSLTLRLTGVITVMPPNVFLFCRGQTMARGLAYSKLLI